MKYLFLTLMLPSVLFAQENKEMTLAQIEKAIKEQSIILVQLRIAATNFNLEELHRLKKEKEKEKEQAK